MGVKVKLADTREVGDKKYKAGDVVDVDPSEARLLVAVGAGAVVDGKTVPESTPGSSGRAKDQPAAGDEKKKG